MDEAARHLKTEAKDDAVTAATGIFGQDLGTKVASPDCLDAQPGGQEATSK